jgi:N-acetyl-gamma-glutamyl-phosphate reductase
VLEVGVVGATGYTGVELLRLLVGHPQVNVRVVTSRSEAGLRVDRMFPSLRGHLPLSFSEPDLALLSECDVVFFATPNGTAMKMVPSLLEKGCKVIDLSADFRLKEVAIWEKWYGMTHACPDYLHEAVYGLPEVNRDAIRKARLVANPGCYPTAVQLGFLPLLASDAIDTNFLIADVKSGVSGAGRKAEVSYLLCEVSESMKAYAINGHRHLPEVTQGLNAVAKNPVNLTFMPHLTPMIRGIQASLYAPLRNKSLDLQGLFESYYKDEPFVDVLEPGLSPETRNVRGTNRCQLAVCRPQQGNVVAVLAVEDNLVKGAAGQAIQNMNLICGFNETTGLELVASIP